MNPEFGNVDTQKYLRENYAVMQFVSTLGFGLECQRVSEASGQMADDPLGRWEEHSCGWACSHCW